MDGVRVSGKILSVFTVFHPEYTAVMINCQSADNQFIKAILIDIAGGHIVITLTSLVFIRLSHKVPLKAQFTVSQRICGNRCLCVVSPVKQHCRYRLRTTRIIFVHGQVRNGNIVSCRTVSAVVRFAPCAKISGGIDIIHRVNHFPGQTVKYRNIFIGIAIYVAVGFNVRSGKHRSVTYIGNDGTLVRHVKLTCRIGLVTYGAIGSLNKEFRFTVFIQIIEHKLVEMRAGRHLQPKVQSPERCSVQFIQVKNRRRRRRHSVTGVKRIIRIPLHDKFIFTIPIHIRDTHIIE